MIHKRKLMVFFCLGFLIYGLTLNLAITNQNKNSVNQNSEINMLQSTDPLNPDLLSDGIPEYESYPSNETFYYYKTYNMSNTDYHLVWLYMDDALNDFDLFLYSDSGYSNLIDDSTSSVARCEWVIYRPVSDMYAYPKTYTYSGNGNAFIESKSGYDISLGSSYSMSLGANDAVEIYEYSLTAGTPYLVDLDVPSTANYDLHVFRMAAGSISKTDYHSSISSTVGQDEQISFAPAYTDVYAIVIFYKSGSGTGYLTLNSGIDPLSDDVSEFKTYSSQYTYYYYSTYSMADNDYHLVWLHEESVSDSFTLDLYTDASYTTSYSWSSGSTQVEWIVYRPSLSKTMYPRVYTSSSTGNATIEAESGYDLNLGDTMVGSLSTNDSAELYEVSLSPSKTTTISLTMPATANYDLYVFKLYSDYSTKDDEQTSASSTLGQTETITFVPQYSDTYAIVIIRRSGSGSYTLTTSGTTIVPGFELVPIFLAMTLIILLYMATSRKRWPFFKTL